MCAKRPSKPGVSNHTLRAPTTSTNKKLSQTTCWRSARASATKQSGWGARCRSSARFQGALGNLAAHTCCAGTSGICTQKTPLRSGGKDTTHDASGARCSVIQNTPDTSTRRCVRRGQSGEHRGTRPSRRPWPSGSYSMSKGKCWRKLSCSVTLDKSSPRMTTMSGQCGIRLRKLGGYGHEWGKFSRGTTLRRSQRQVLQGSCADGPPLWKRDMEPHIDCIGAVGGVPHQSRLPYGCQT
jgi:hypothetical protein